MESKSDSTLRSRVGRMLEKQHARVLGEEPTSWLSMSRAALRRWRRSVVEVDGIKLKMSPSLSVYMTSRLGTGFHSRPERRLVLPELQKGDRVMELGGGVGHLATRCALIVGSDNVTVFEGNPELRPVMQDNFEVNGVNPTAHFCILGEEAGETAFYVGRHFWNSSARRQHQHNSELRVPVEPFNDVVRTISPTVLIVDIEGGEVDLFRYADLSMVKKLMVEFHPNVTTESERKEMLARIEESGFELKRKDGHCHLFHRTQEVDAHDGA